jgi:hypothetical protein
MLCDAVSKVEVDQGQQESRVLLKDKCDAKGNVVGGSQP